MRNMRLLLICLMGLGTSLASCSEAPAPDGPASDEAIVAIALPERQMRTMLLTGSLGTQTVPMAMQSLGLQRGCEELESAVDAAVQTHLPAWRRNLVAAYRETVPPDELASAAQASPRSAQRQLREHSQAIGAAMQAKSSTLLNEAGGDVLERLAGRAATVENAAVDSAARMSELEQARRDGDLCREQIQSAERTEA